VGLLKHVLFWPVTGPMALSQFALRQVEGVVHRELTDDERVKEDLMQLQMELEIGALSEEEYQRREAAVLERLREVRQWRQKLGLEEEWAPLEFPSAGAAPQTPPPTGDPSDGGGDAWPPGSSTSSDPDSPSS
jgi:hypothetical protein